VAKATKRPKKPRPLPKSAPRVRKAKAKKPKKPAPLVREALPKTHIVRQQALADYVSDPEGHEAAWHYGRKDREYRHYATLAMFESWGIEDNWELQREAYWAEAQRQLLEKTRDNTVQILADSMHDLNELRTHALEWCDPIRDEEGEVLRYPEEDDEGNPHRYAGKPMLAVRPKSFEAAVAAALALDEAVQNRRDEILRMTGQGDAASKPVADPVIAAVNLSPADLRAIGKELVKRRQPELVEHAIDIEPEGHEDG
jgi:hypothetical protein